LSLAPVLVFLFSLALIDTYKLLRLRRILETMGVGCVVAVVCYGLNTTVFGMAPAGLDTWARFGAPVMEEVGKALYVVWLIRASRVGFMVDTAVSGFALGAGFAVIENLAYLPMIAGAGLATAAVRGLGTALMHGGTTAIFGLVSVNRSEISGSYRPLVFAPGLAIAIVIHSLYNQALLPPLVAAEALLVLLPAVFSFIFWRGEKSLEKWVGTKLDKDMDLLHMLATGTFTESHAGRYLRSLDKTFGAVLLGDMLCYLQLSLELSAQAKGDLLRREMGFPAAPDPQLPAKLKEMAYLERQFGRAGKLALIPLLGSSRRNVWELQQLAEKPSG
jgi:RsiW-degrading membrane proteinase PrsW (M82 family)